MAEDKTMLLKIKADVSDMKKALSDIDKQLLKVGADGKKTGSKVGTAFTKAGKGLKNFKSSLMSVQSIMGGMMVKGVYDMATAQRKLAMQTEALRSNKAYGGLAKDFENIENATHGMVNQFEIVGAVNKAMAFGIDLSCGKLQRLIKAAQKASIAMGTDLKTSIDDMMTAMGRGSVMIADNLGATFKLGEANKAYADKLGITTSALTANQKKLAFNEMFLGRLETAYVHLGDDKLYDPIIENQKRLSKAWQGTKKSITSAIVASIDFIQKASIGFAMQKVAKDKRHKQEVWRYNEIERLMKKFNTTRESASRLFEFREDRRHKQNAKRRLEIEGYEIRQKVMQEKIASVIGGISGKYKEINSEHLKASKIKDDQKKKDDAIAAKAKEQRIRDAKARAIRIKDAEDELKQRKESGLYDEKEMIMFEKKVKMAKAMTKSQKVKIDIDITRTITTIEKKAKEKEKDAADTKQDKADAAQLDREIIQAGYDFEASAFDLHQSNMKRKRKMLSEDAIEHNKKQESAKLQHQTAINKLEQAGADTTNTIMQGAIEALYKMDEDYFIRSLGVAMGSIGNKLVLDGISTLWQGHARNSLFPGTGIPAVGVGLSEIAVGGAMVAGGMKIGSEFAAGGGSSGGAQERNEETKEDKIIQSDVKVSLYPSRTAMKKDFTNNGILIKG